MIYPQEEKMTIQEFKNRLSLIISFTVKMKDATIPHGAQRIMLRIYAGRMKLNLTDRAIDSILLKTEGYI
jgi:hypothetical protein